MWRGLALAATAWSVSGCIHARDFHEPKGRLTDNTAYSEQGPVRFEVGAVGRNEDQLGATVAVRAAPIPGRLEIGTNAAHLGLGIINLQTKGTIVDRPKYGLGARLGFRYINSRTLWVLPRDVRKDFGRIHVASVPVEVINTFPFARWFDLNLGVGYRHAEIWGVYSGSEFVAEGAVAGRELYLEPYLHFYAGKRVAIIAGAHLPAWSQGLSNAVAEIDVVDGVKLGVQSAEWIRLPPVTFFRAELALEARFGRRTNIRLSVIHGLLKPLQRPALLPALNIYWRFGGPYKRRPKGSPAVAPPNQQLENVDASPGD